jgi:hypothetical protein
VSQLTWRAVSDLRAKGREDPAADADCEDGDVGRRAVTVIDAAVGDSIGVHKGARLAVRWSSTARARGLRRTAAMRDRRRRAGWTTGSVVSDGAARGRQHVPTAGLPPHALLPLAGVRLLSGGPPTWPETLTSIRTSIDGQDQPGELSHLGERDLTVTLTLSERPTELSGVVRDAAGTARPDASIYIFRSDRALWTAGAPSREVRPNRRGEYRADLPPGEYLVTASATARCRGWSPRRCGCMDGATAVRLVRGDKRLQDLIVKWFVYHCGVHAGAGPVLVFLSSSETIAAVVRDIEALTIEGCHEIVLVNDRSEDRTGESAARSSRTHASHHARRARAQLWRAQCRAHRMAARAWRPHREPRRRRAESAGRGRAPVAGGRADRLDVIFGH